MSLDISTLQLLKRRPEYERIHRHIPSRALDAATRVVLDDFGRYFRETPGAQVVDFSAFQTLFKLWHPSVPDDKLAIYGQLFAKCQADPDPTVADGLLNRLRETASTAELADAIERYNNGEEVDITRAVSRMAERMQEETGKFMSTDLQDRTPIGEILAETDNDFGLKFRLDVLNQNIRPLRYGDFVIIGARVDVGKTTLCASELTWMAGQMDTVYPDQNRSVIWLLNEGSSKRAVERCFQAALGATLSELSAWNKDGSLGARYSQALGGRAGALRIFPVHDMTMADIEQKILRKHRPGAIVFDMLDNVKYDGDVSNGGTRTDQILEGMYQRARVLGVKHDCPVFATSQLNAEAADELYPGLHMLANGRTGKPGTADLIIMLAKAKAEMFDGVRYVSTPKNKLRRQGAKGDVRAEVIFQGDRAIITDPIAS